MARNYSIKESFSQLNRFIVIWMFWECHSSSQIADFLWSHQVILGKFRLILGLFFPSNLKMYKKWLEIIVLSEFEPNKSIHNHLLCSGSDNSSQRADLLRFWLIFGKFRLILASFSTISGWIKWIYVVLH